MQIGGPNQILRAYIGNRLVVDVPTPGVNINDGVVFSPLVLVTVSKRCERVSGTVLSVNFVVTFLQCVLLIRRISVPDDKIKRASSG